MQKMKIHTMSKERQENELKTRRIVSKMCKELENTDVNDDFQNALQSMAMPESDKQLGFNGFLALQGEIKAALKNHLKYGNGAENGILSLLSSKQLKSVTQILKGGSRSRSRSKSKSKSATSSAGNSKHSPTGGRPGYGSSYVGAKVTAIESERKKFAIPRLEVDKLDEKGDGDGDEEEYPDWVSARNATNSGRKQKKEEDDDEFPDWVSARKQANPQVDPEPAIVPNIPKRIQSRPRPVEKNDAEIQTDDVKFEEVPGNREDVAESAENAEAGGRQPAVQVVDIGTSCHLLTSPRVEGQLEDPSPILSPTSSVSEGEVVGGLTFGRRVTVVRSDGSIVQPGVETPRIGEDRTDRKDELDEDRDYFGESESDILHVASFSPLRVAEIDFSITPTPPRSIVSTCKSI